MLTAADVTVREGMLAGLAISLWTLLLATVEMLAGLANTLCTRRLAVSKFALAPMIQILCISALDVCTHTAP